MRHKSAKGNEERLQMTKAEGPMWVEPSDYPATRRTVGIDAFGSSALPTADDRMPRFATAGRPRLNGSSRSLVLSLAPIHLGPRLSLTAFSGAHHAADAKPGRTQFAPISGCLSPPQFWGAVIARTCRRSSHTAMILASKSRSHGYSFVERKRPVPCRRPIWR
jgi:hypothetical protein